MNINLYILKYNNYYNRIVKKLNNINDYSSYTLELFSNINFNPNDGIQTEQIINYDGDMPDYCICTNAAGDIVSRWFIIESQRIRAQQYRLLLYRDVIVDWYDDIVRAPMFIEKATLPYGSPLLFNEEDMTVNQIKKGETTLSDRSNIPWLVGYYTKGERLNGTVAINDQIDAIDLNVQTINDWEYYKYYTGAQNYDGSEMIAQPISGYYKFNYRAGNQNVGLQVVPYVISATVNQFTGDTTAVSAGLGASYQLAGIKNANDVKAGFVNFGLSSLNPSPYSGAVSTSKTQDLLSYSGSLVRTLDGKYYRITVNSTAKSNTIAISSGALFNNLSTIASRIGLTGTPNAETFKYSYTANCYTLNIEQRTDLETTYDIVANRLVTTDAPWDIFAIPLKSVKVIKEDGTNFTTNGDVSLATAMAIQAQQATRVHDIQVLPYCPVQALISAKNTIKLTDSRQYSFILDKSSNPVGVILNVPNSRFSFNITDINGGRLTPAQTNIDRKIKNECEKWRLTSPNYSNYFDFSVEKNDGVSFFNVDCEYKPFTPYIHINPNFSYLYGFDDNSPRGLVLGGDFSISQIIDQWQQYQIQNKNFQNIFDRQIQNMEVRNNYQRTMEKLNVITGSMSGAVAGATLGGKAGPYGAIAGAVVGGVGSAAAGMVDIQLQEQLRNETIDYTRDQFGYQLGNIQALPNTISKVSSLNQNNKIFPVLEYYTCTPEERVAFANKLAYNGMTVMVIGKMEDYIGNTWTYTDPNLGTVIASKGYIKGKLIRLESLADDYHIINTIAEELNKGVFI